eukprot:756467-Hanusia_phi.AAC.1
MTTLRLIRPMLCTRSVRPGPGVLVLLSLRLSRRAGRGRRRRASGTAASSMTHRTGSEVSPLITKSRDRPMRERQGLGCKSLTTVTDSLSSDRDTP